MKKIYYFEGIRGIAAVVVLLSHFAQVFYPALLTLNTNVMHNNIESEIPQTVFNIFYNGNFAVCIFFILSGYVLSNKYFLNKENKILIESAVKRYFRLVIPVIISVIFAFIILRLDLFYYGSSTFYTKATMTDFYSMEPNLIRALKQGLYGAFFENEVVSYNAVLWTMYYELFGSLLVFSFLAFFGKLRLRYVFYFVLLVCFWNTYFIAFVLGMLLCDANNSLENDFLKFFKNKIIVLLVYSLGIFLGSFPYINLTGTIYEYLIVPGLNINYFMMYHILGAFLLLIAILGSEPLQKLLSIKLFRFLGNISFSMYLTHFIIICSFSSYIFIKLISNGLTYNTSFIITFFLSLIVIFTISYFMYKYIDSKSVRFSKWVYTRIFKNRPN